jgi:hypothetical protein
MIRMMRARFVIAMAVAVIHCGGDPTNTEPSGQGGQTSGQGGSGTGATGGSGSGAAGGSGGAAGAMCGVDIKPGKECDAGCSSCDMGVCVISCAGASACATDAINCPPDQPCRIECDGAEACRGAIVQCPMSDHSCALECTGPDACRDAALLCAPAAEHGSCSLSCDGGGAPCQGLQMQCGLEKCEASCSDSGEPTPNVSCGGSCDCTACG